MVKLALDVSTGVYINMDAIKVGPMFRYLQVVSSADERAASGDAYLFQVGIGGWFELVRVGGS